MFRFAEAFEDFQTKVRADAAKRWKSNRRVGGRKTQSSVMKYVRPIQIIHTCSCGLVDSRCSAENRIRDDIVDEHSLLLFIKFSANRCRRLGDCQFPNTRIGPVRSLVNPTFLFEYFAHIMFQSQLKTTTATILATKALSIKLVGYP